MLLFENVRQLEYNTKKQETDILVQKLLLDQLNAVSDFLIHGFVGRLDTDKDLAHYTERALVRINSSSRNNSQCAV